MPESWMSAMGMTAGKTAYETQPTGLPRFRIQAAELNREAQLPKINFLNTWRFWMTCSESSPFEELTAQTAELDFLE
jgi:hypothetical protein